MTKVRLGVDNVGVADGNGDTTIVFENLLSPLSKGNSNSIRLNPAFNRFGVISATDEEDMPVDKINRPSLNSC